MEQTSYLGSDTDPTVAPTSDEKTLAVLSHILTLVGGFIAPLIIYLMKKDESPFVGVNAKESLNFQITIFIIIIGLFITVIGILLIWLVGLFSLVCVIIATVKTNEGKLYRYPLNFRFIK